MAVMVTLDERLYAVAGMTELALKSQEPVKVYICFLFNQSPLDRCLFL